MALFLIAKGANPLTLLDMINYQTMGVRRKFSSGCHAGSCDKRNKNFPWVQNKVMAMEIFFNFVFIS